MESCRFAFLRSIKYVRERIPIRNELDVADEQNCSVLPSRSVTMSILGTFKKIFVHFLQIGGGGKGGGACLLPSPICNLFALIYLFIVFFTSFYPATYYLGL